MLRWEIHVCHRFFNAVLDLFGGFLQFHCAKTTSFAFLSVYRFQHSRHFTHSISRICWENVAIKMTVQCWYLSSGNTSFTDPYPYPRTYLQQPFWRLLSRASSARQGSLSSFTVLFQTLDCTHDLAITIAVYSNRYKYAGIVELAAPKFRQDTFRRAFPQRSFRINGNSRLFPFQKSRLTASAYSTLHPRM